MKWIKNLRLCTIGILFINIYEKYWTDKIYHQTDVHWGTKYIYGSKLESNSIDDIFILLVELRIIV